MRCLRWLLFALVCAVPCAQADDPPKPDPEKPAEEPEGAFAPGKLRLALDAGGHTGFITRVQFTADGKYLVTASNDNTIRVYDGHTGQSLRVLRTPGRGSLFALAPDSHTLAAPFTYRQEDKNVHAIALMALADGKIERVLKGHTDLICAVAFSADGKRLASSSKDMTLRVWDLAGGEPETVIKIDKKVFGLAFSPNGKRLVEAREDDLPIIRNIENGKTIVLKGAKSLPWWGSTTVAWSPDGKTISWRSVEKPKAWEGGPTSFNLHEMEVGPPLPERQLRGPVLKKGPFSLKTHEWQPFDVLKNDRPFALKPPPSPPNPGMHSVGSLVGKDRLVTSNGNGLALVDLNTGKTIHKFSGHRGTLSLAPSPDADGRRLLTLSEDRVLRVWDTEKGTVLMLLTVFGQEWLAWTPHGYYAASPGGEKLIGWVVDNGFDQAPGYHPAQRFRKHFYQPDILKLVLEKGSLDEALMEKGLKSKNLDQVLPPRAIVSHKRDGAKVSVEVTAQAGSKAQPVTELSLLIDGRPARLENGQLAVKGFETPVDQASGGREPPVARGAWTVALEPGAHKLSVRATSRDAYSISEEVAIDVPMPMVQPAKTRATLYYVGIGVNKFQLEPELNLTGAVPDIKNMEQCLTSKEMEKSLPREVKPTVLTDDKATLSAILKTLTELQGQLRNYFKNPSEAPCSR